jgi:arsenite methyltransferase
LTNTAGPEPSSGLLRYGVDAPKVPAIFAALGAVAIGVGVAAGITWLIIAGLLFLVQAAVFLHTTLRGKFAIWRTLLTELSLKGNEDVLDVGCGRGAVLIEAAQQLPNGSATGLDLWRSVDQSGNNEQATRRNAEHAGVSDRVQLHTADMTKMPFENDSFDAVVSSIAIHNISSRDERVAAISEIVRVLRPGGRIVIADLRHTNDYAEQFKRAGFDGVRIKGLGPNFWFGGPWMAASVVTAAKLPAETNPAK